MKKPFSIYFPRLCCMIAAVLLLLVSHTKAATVGASGYANDFGTRPPAEDWATTSIAGGAGDGYEMDAAVNTDINAISVTAQAEPMAGDPPAAFATAVWHSTAFYLQTRPTGNRYAALVAKFVNNTATNATEVRVTYDFTIVSSGVSEEAGRGNRAYYSLTGTPGSWINLPALNTAASASASSTVSTNIAVNWTNGASLYLLWADDNATGQGTDSANQIDNFSLQVTAGVPLSTALTATLNAPTNNALFVSGTAITAATTVALGTAPYTVQYFLNGGAGFTPAGSASTPPFNLSLGSLTAGTYDLYAVATDTAVPAASTNTMTNTFFVADAITLTLTNPANEATFDNATSITGAATVSGGTAPYSVQFYLDNTPNGAPITSAPFERNFGPLFVGDHTIRASVRDAKGWVSNTVAHTIHVTGPLGVTLTPTNGAGLSFGQSVTLVAAPGGGTPPYNATFYTNGQAAGSINSAPFALNLGLLPPGSYSSYVHVTDSAAPAGQADSTINTFSVAPNPIILSLTTPTNGQSGFPGATLALAATASVNAPITITNVEFFYDGTLVAADNSAPYSASVSGTVQGNHTVYAAATDSLGRRSFSTTNQVTITAPPGSNDLFANAIPLLGPVVSTTGNNSTATKQFGGPQGEPIFIAGNLGGASVWWTWTATASGPTTIDTQGSDFDTLLGVFTGSAQNQLTLVAENNDFEGNTWSRVQFNAIAGTVYRIVVDGNGPFRFPPTPARGNIRLNIKGVGGVEISSPTNGAVFTLGDSIPVDVRITSDFPNPPATRVDFYVNGNLFASSTTGPFHAVATNVPAGSNIVYAVAVDSQGQTVQSAPVPIFVQKIGVTLLTPFDSTMFPNTNPITVTAWAFLPSGSITNIEFFVDRVKFGEDSTFPYAATWTNVTAGSHRLTAVGRSDTGVAYQSQPVNIGVATVIVPFASVWKYLDDGSDQGTAWTARGFDDSSWASGPAPLGYSDSNGRLPATTNSFGPDPNAKYTNTYYRQSFMVTNVAGFGQLTLGIERDDGAVVYLNGTEIGRFNMPTGLVTSVTPALNNANDDGGTIFTLNVNRSLLQEGLNTFAVEIHQDNTGNSSDIWFRMQVVGEPVIIRNQFPTVAITNPTNDQFFIGPASVPIAATAADEDGAVAKVEFFVDRVKLGESTNSAATFNWETPPVGPHVLTAIVTDDQGGSQESAPINIVVYDGAGTPFARITQPTDGAGIEGGTNLLIKAYASAPTGITNVQFFGNGVAIGESTTSPFAVVWDAPFGTNLLSAVAYDANGISGTSAVATITVFPNTTAPRIASQVPAPNLDLTSFTNLIVTFSERVQHVDAGDLLVSGIPATGVTGSGSNYVFTFPQPPYGEVEIAWANGHGITDFGYPADLPFNELSPDAQWEYDLIDRTAPTVLTRFPATGSIVTNLSEITVTFSELVSGVDAGDLLVNGTPATGLSGSGSNYTFNVIQPPSGTVNITWAASHGITDRAADPPPNPFNGATGGWSFTLDTRTTLVQSNAVWRFVKGTNEASTPIDAWRQLAFDDSGWSNSPAPFFFGDTYTNATITGTLLSDMLGGYTSIYLRKEFNVLNRGGITNLLLNAQSDDGFVAWINGVEILRYNVAAGVPAYNGVASSAAPEPGNNGAGYIVYNLPNAVAALVDGTNVLTVQAFNQSLSASTDFGFNAQLYTYLTDASTVPPRLLTPIPAQGDVLSLSELTVRFSEGVTGIDAADLLVNGVPASGVSSSTNTTYTFTFAQPPYGSVVVTWDTNHAIVDLDTPPKPFDGNAVSSILRYTLINPSNPRITSQIPLAGTTVTGLTAVVVTFTEPVNGVEAADFLVNGVSANGVTSLDNTSYTFSFTQPLFGAVAIRWATNHGIVDVEAGNAFDPTRFGGQWNYTLIDPVPSVVLTSPTNGTYRLEPANVTLTATANDNDGAVVRVEFFEGANKLGESTNAPYSVSWTNVQRGAYVLKAVATDNIGLMGTSAPVVLNVVTNLPAFLLRGPYLQVGTPTSGVVRWRTDIAVDALVYYGTDPLNLTNSAVELTVTNEHIVQISGLEPASKYFYSIGTAGQRLAGTNGLDSDYWFNTSPVPGTKKPTRLWVIGDAGTAGNGPPDRQASTRDAFYNYAATTRPADLWLMLGDNAYNSGQDSEHQAAVFDMYPRTLRNLFLWPTIGNHESSQSFTATDFPYLHIFSLPRNGEAGGVPSGTEKYYSFDYANIHFVCLDSMTSGRATNATMVQWLKDDLTAAAAEWLIVFFHHPPYTRGNHNSDNESELIEIRQNILPILESYGVDLVLCGHSHAWERSFLLHGHYGLSGTITNSMKIDAGDGREDGTGAYKKNAKGQGVVYTVAGNAGQVTGGQLNHPAHFLSLNELGSMVIDITSNRLDAIFLTTDGTTHDHFTLIKRAPPVPAAPFGLVAIPASASEIRLTWSDEATNELGYVIERSLDGVNFAELLTASPDTTTALDSGLLANTVYFYRARATNAIGASPWSNLASARTVIATSLPQAPTDLVAASDDGFQFFRGQMLLNWRDRSSNEAGFQIERSTDGISFVPVATVAANFTSYLDHDLASSSTYFYRVRALNSLGFSASSNLAGDETHPQSQLVREGQSAIFHGGVEGEQPLRYQWRFMGIAIPGQTNETLLLNNVQFSDAGEYTVAVTNITGEVVSNPAFLSVVVPPHIATQPQDTDVATGGTATFSVAANGTEPFTYQWRRNGGPVSGANSPALTLGNAQLADQAGYDVIVMNDYGSATSRVAALTVFAPPTLAQLPELFAEVLKPLIVSNVTTDLNVPPLELTYSLAPGAPTNAHIHLTTGVFRWTPTRAQAPSTNLITVRVADKTRPQLNGSTTFTVYVNDYVEVSVGSLVMLAGTNGVVPISLFSSADLTELECLIRFATDRFNSIAVEELLPARAGVGLEMVGSNIASLRFTARPGNMLQGTQQLAQLRLSTAPGTTSGFVPLHVGPQTALMARASVAPTMRANDGRVTIIGNQPLLEANIANNQRVVTLYGTPGFTYRLEFSTNGMAAGAWRNRASVPLTNFSRAISIGNQPPPSLPVVFRAVR